MVAPLSIFGQRRLLCSWLHARLHYDDDETIICSQAIMVCAGFERFDENNHSFVPTERGGSYLFWTEGMKEKVVSVVYLTPL